ncbi:MAG TPA: hypothetical protein VL463_18855 [Kofleriaceae bacterium]|nr:hypothetical protein [Kofleriaceae bacterium]
MRAVVVLGVALAAGCSFDRSGLGSQQNGSADASVIDAPANVPDTPPGTPDAPPSVPDAKCTDTCAGMTLQTCGGPDQQCDLGCSMTGGAHCEVIVPSNGATDADDLTGVTGALTATNGLIVAIDTDTGSILSTTDLQNWTTVRDPGTGVIAGISYRQENGLAVFGVDSIDWMGGSYIRPYNNHGVIFLARNDIEIDGYVDLSGGCNDSQNQFVRSCAGPGGGTGGAIGAAGMGCAGGGASVHQTGQPDSGGGGGGFGKDGGNGGDGDGTHKGGAGGKASGCTGATLVPLVGGGGGGGGGTGAVGGGGGGAVQFTSLLGSITMNTTANTPATVDAGGRGGGASAGAGGGGGGAGGGILLEARAITMLGANVTSNGGGGGAGRVGTTNGIGGKGSATSATPAAGGVDDINGKGGGGDGGAGTTGATAGQGPTDGGGGGGGAIGRVRFNVPMASLSITGGVVSPAQSRGDLTLQ